MLITHLSNQLIISVSFIFIVLFHNNVFSIVVYGDEIKVEESSTLINSTPTTTSSTATNINNNNKESSPKVPIIIVAERQYHRPQHHHHDADSADGNDHKHINEIANNFDQLLQQIQNTELGVSFIQNIYNTMEFKRLLRNDTKIVQTIADKLSKKLKQVELTINETRQMLNKIILASNITTNHKNNYQRHIHSVVWPCRNTDNTDDHQPEQQEQQHYDRKQIEIINYDSNESQISTINLQIINAITNNLNQTTMSNIKQLYFVSRDDIVNYQLKPYHQLSRCNPKQLPLHLQQQFIGTIQHKYIFLLIDYGNTINMNQLTLIKSITNTIIDQLINDHKTYINLITISDNIGAYNKNYMTTITNDNKRKLHHFVNNLNGTSAITNHTLGFQYSFELMKKMLSPPSIYDDDDDDDIVPIFIYISRGLLLPLTDAKNVLESIANGQRALPRPVIINTCAIVLDEKRVMYEKQFLKDVAVQNYSKYGINVSDWWSKSKFGGEMFVINRTLSESSSESDEEDSDEDENNDKTVIDENMMKSVSAAMLGKWFQKQFLYQQYRTTKLIINQPILLENSIQNHRYDTIISMTNTIDDIGILGIDLYLSDLAEDVIYYNKYQNSYAFICDKNGITIMHPTYPRPLSLLKRLPYETQIIHLEQSKEFTNEIYAKMLSNEYGNETINKNEYYITYTWQHTKYNYIVCIVTKKYNKLSSLLLSTNYRHFHSHKYHQHDEQQSNRSSHHYYDTNDDIINDDNNILLHTTSFYYEQQPYHDLHYHRIDLNLLTEDDVHSSKKLSMCQQFKQISSRDSITLFLSASAFKSPFIYIKNIRHGNEIPYTIAIKNIMAYIKDHTNLLANPGLLANIRNDVHLLYHIMKHLKKRHLDSTNLLHNYIVRRYVSTQNGVILVYPGTIITDNLMPNLRPWYRKAMQYKGNVIITEPYLDAAGAGYIITIAQTIMQNIDNKTSPSNVVMAIVAIDLTIGIAYKLLLQSGGKLCIDTQVKCFLMDDKGYLIAHPSVLEPLVLVDVGASNLMQNKSQEKKKRRRRRRRLLEHITHKESYIANDILYHREFVEKRLCNNYFNHTRQRYYQFNTTTTNVLTNIAHNERTKYFLKPITNTNLFIGILNTTGGIGDGAFCPCSTIDRMCLNCNRMEQTYCECPCECLLNIIETDDDDDDDDQTTTICDNTIDLLPLPIPIDDNENVVIDDSLSSKLNALQPCAINNCEIYMQQLDCLGVIDCVWCQIDVDGQSLFSLPFCTKESLCYNGIFGSLTPYDNIDSKNTNNDNDFDSDAIQTINSISIQTYSAIGPIIGAIFALCLIVGLAMYCYKQNSDIGTEHLYVESIPENNCGGVQMSRFDYDDIIQYDCKNDDGMGGIGGGGGGGKNGIEQYNLNEIEQNNFNVLVNNDSNSIIMPADISPYRMNCGIYRRPNGESDNGYSTMTPHEDSSEHNACFALAEPLINNKRLSVSDSMSINTSISSPTNNVMMMMTPSGTTTTTNKFKCNDDDLVDNYKNTNDGMTKIKSPHHIQAAVTVHHPMEAL